MTSLCEVKMNGDKFMKNIIFDIGNVLLNFQPDAYLDKYYDKQTKEDLMMIIFSSDEWELLDLGNLMIDDVIDVLCGRYPHYKEEITFVLKTWTNMLTPIKENVDIVYKLKEKGYKLYLLSNFHYEAIQTMFDKYDFFNLFDGEVISGFEHMMKPNYKIFELLLDRYDLKASECLFIDDMAGNIAIAHTCGIDGIHLGLDVVLEGELKKRNII